MLTNLLRDASPLVLILARATVVALIGRLLLAAMTRASASARYLVAVTTFCSMLAIPLVSLAGIEWRLAVFPPNQASAPAITTAETPIEGDASIFRPASRSVVPAAPASEDVFALPHLSWRAWLLGLVAAIGAAFAARMLFGIVAIRWITARAQEIDDETILRDFDVAAERLGVTRMVRLLASDRVGVPLVWGIVRPALLLPAGATAWPRERLRVVFLHELAHLRRGDPITLLLTRAVAAIYWFHPVVWSLDRVARRDCEQACDDLVLAGGTRASDYADHLLGIARALPARDPFGAVTLAMSRRSHLEGRLLSILDPHARRDGVSRRGALLAALVAAALVIPVSAIRLTAQPAPAEVRRAVEKRTGGEWYEAARAAHAEERYGDAIFAYRKSIELGYRPAASMFNVACIYALENDRESALHWLEKAVANGFDSKAVADDGDLDSLRGDKRFVRIAERSPQAKKRSTAERYDAPRPGDARSADEWYQIGKRYIREEDYPRAIEAYSEVIRIDPYAGSAWYNMACAQALSGDRRALDTLEQSLLHNFGGDSEKLLTDPDLESIHGPRLDELARLADDLELRNEGNDWSEAIERYARIAQRRPNIARAWFNYGFALCEGGQPRQAVEAFTRTLNMGYRQPTVMYNLGCSYALMGDRQSALSWLMKAQNAGFDVGCYAKDDKDLASLRGDGWLAERIAEAKQRKQGKEKE